MKRREFIKTTGAGLVIGCTCGAGINSCTMFSGISNTPVAPADSYHISPENVLEINLSKLPELSNKGGSVKLTINPDGQEKKLLVFNTGRNKYKTFLNSCTHGGQELEYKHNKNIVQCVSFGHSKYDLQGNVLSGPAPEPVLIFETTTKNGQLHIQLDT
jgi:Rieske Fe-S protein